MRHRLFFLPAFPRKIALLFLFLSSCVSSLFCHYIVTLFCPARRNDELKSLVECNDAVIDTQFTDCPAARSMERIRKSLIESNRLLAQENIEKETRFFDLRNTLLKMYQEAKELKIAIEQMQDRNPHLKTSTPDLDSIQAVLEAAAREAEDASEVRDSREQYHAKMPRETCNKLFAKKCLAKHATKKNV